MRRIFALFSIALLLAFVPVQLKAMPLTGRVIVLDAGHGGRDPGMVASGVEEKHINLAIAEKVQALLEAADATVIVTRNEDVALGAKKRSDMYSRSVIANTARADIFVSIHCNSFTRSSVHGAQAFYFDTSNNSASLAKCIQDAIRTHADPANKFEAKANDNYYVLKQTEMPAVLVECGFLTNASERSKLQDELYQYKMAYAIYRGILDYFYMPAGV